MLFCQHHLFDEHFDIDRWMFFLFLWNSFWSLLGNTFAYMNMIRLSEIFHRLCIWWKWCVQLSYWNVIPTNAHDLASFQSAVWFTVRMVNWSLIQSKTTESALFSLINLFSIIEHPNSLLTILMDAILVFWNIVFHSVYYEVFQAYVEKRRKGKWDENNWIVSLLVWDEIWLCCCGKIEVAYSYL